jgi:hypothetical protein
MEERRTAASKRQPPSLSAAQQIAMKLTTMTAAASPTELFASSTKKPIPNAITKASSISPQPMNSNFSLSRHMAEFNASKKKPRLSGASILVRNGHRREAAPTEMLTRASGLVYGRSRRR